MGIWNTHTSIGNISGSLIASTMLAYGCGWSFVFPGVLIGFAGLILFLLLPVSPESVGAYEDDDEIIPSPEKSGAVTEPLVRRDVEVRNRPVGFIEAWKIPGVAPFTLCLFFAKLVAYTFLYWLPFYISHTAIDGKYLSSQTAGTLSTLFDVGGVLGGILAGHISDRLNTRAVTAASFMYCAIPALYFYRSYGHISLTLNLVFMFNQGAPSKVQRQMIPAILSFADYFRPKFFLLENVRYFITFNKGKTFRLTLASLLEMGYQVRFGVLEAGAYGILQTRKRAFIWAASPEEILPKWPEPMHVFAGSDLKISLPGSSSYVAVASTANGAPFRAMTVRDSIGDLPTVLNGASATTMEYQNEPVSWYQEKSRKKSLQLTDHISKEMTELRLIRCQTIPKRPGADWRELPDKKVKLATGKTVKMIPKSLSNPAETHNQGKGMYGRLDWEGKFPTAVTDPQPAGKVGRCFHPDQDRIITVRECARSQGFSDAYKFCGNIQYKNRQIGNAVPPPLAYALGRKLKEALRQKQLNSTVPKP